jgi:hypothetical protein
MATSTSNIAVGLGAVVAAVIVAPVLVPAVAAAGRPLAKSLIKGGLMLYEKGREAVAVAGEAAEDILAEIRAEEAQRRAGAAAAPPSGQAGQTQTASADVQGGTVPQGEAPEVRPPDRSAESNGRPARAAARAGAGATSS